MSLTGQHNMKAIKAEGGITFAQDEATAKYHGMPRSAIAAGYVDFVLPPEAIAKELARIGRHPYVNGVRLEKAEELVTEDESNFNKILFTLRSATGVDFTHYKPTTIKRRIMRRMVLHKIEELKNYLKYIQTDGKEVEALYNDILINVTGFFRDPLENGFQISKTIRDMCVFARQNVVKDPPFSKLDLISCRNVLIYLGPVLQKKIMPVFHYALRPTGFMMLGSSETIGGFADLFSLVDKKYKIYAKKTTLHGQPAPLRAEQPPLGYSPAPAIAGRDSFSKYFF